MRRLRSKRLQSVLLAAVLLLTVAEIRLVQARASASFGSAGHGAPVAPAERQRDQGSEQRPESAYVSRGDASSSAQLEPLGWLMADVELGQLWVESDPSTAADDLTKFNRAVGMPLGADVAANAAATFFPAGDGGGASANSAPTENVASAPLSDNERYAEVVLRFRTAALGSLSEGRFSLLLSGEAAEPLQLRRQGSINEVRYRLTHADLMERLAQETYVQLLYEHFILYQVRLNRFGMVLLAEKLQSSEPTTDRTYGSDDDGVVRSEAEDDGYSSTTANSAVDSASEANAASSSAENDDEAVDLDKHLKQQIAPLTDNTDALESRQGEDGAAKASEEGDKLVDRACHILSEQIVDPDRVQEALELLRDASVRFRHSGAMYSLGAIYLSGYWDGDVPRDERFAVELLRRAADVGQPDAQALIATLHASGLSTLVRRDARRAVLYWTAAARGGSIYAQMALAYRLLHGVDVQRDVKRALALYEHVGQRVLHSVQRRIGTATRGLSLQQWQVVDGQGVWQGDYEEMVQFYFHLAEYDDINAPVELGKWILYNALRDDARVDDGTGGVDGRTGDDGDAAHRAAGGGHGLHSRRSMRRAMRLLHRAIEVGDPRAHVILGFMHFHGMLEHASNDSAVQHFTDAAQWGHFAGDHGLGLAHRYGAGVPQDLAKALEHFRRAAMSHHAESVYNVGVMYLRGLQVAPSKDFAFACFHYAAQREHLPAMLQTGKMMRGRERDDARFRNLPYASELLKTLGDLFLAQRLGAAAQHAYHAGNYESALLRYVQLAHAGVEVGQFSAALMMQDRRGTAGSGVDGREDEAALELYRMSAQQDNVEAILKVGDLLYEKAGEYEMSAAVYRQAMEKQSAQAMFNLGYMHMVGRGLSRDLHHAKRYFDLARASSEDAVLPSVLALQALKALRLWERSRRAARMVTDVFKALFFGSGGGRTLYKKTPVGTAQRMAFDLIAIPMLTLVLVGVLWTRQRRLAEHRRAGSRPSSADVGAAPAVSAPAAHERAHMPPPPPASPAS